VSGEIPFEWAPSASGDAAEGSTAFPSCGAEVPPAGSGSDSGSDGGDSSGPASPASDATPVLVAAGILGVGLLAIIAGVIVWAVRRPRGDGDGA
jgi:hypothetical protein